MIFILWYIAITCFFPYPYIISFSGGGTYVLMYGYFTRTGAQKAILQVQLVKKALVCKQRIFFLP